MAQTGTVLSFLRARRSSNDWTQQELAEFYRVESALLQHGLLVTTDRGLSDEGDPWFVFCRSDTEEIIAHFARIDGHYLVISSAFSGVARGRDFRLLVRELMDAHPLMLPQNHGSGQKIFIHPAALLAALLSASYLVWSERDAAVQDVSAPGHEKGSAFWLNFRYEFAILSAVAAAAIWIEHRVESDFDLGPDITIMHDVGQDSNSTGHVASHSFDAPSFDSLPQPIQGRDAPSHAMAGDLTGMLASEHNINPKEVSFFLPSLTPQGPQTQLMGTSAPEANPVAEGSGDGRAASHADIGKASSSVAVKDVAVNDIDHPVDFNFAGDAPRLHGSSAPASVPTSNTPTIATDVVPAMTPNYPDSSSPVVASTASLLPNDALSNSTPSNPSVAASAQASTTADNAVAPSTEISTDSSAQAVASTSTLQTSTGMLPTPATAHMIAAHLVNVKHTEAQPVAEPAILGIISHHADGFHHA
jgi:hypothetical protein